MWESYTFLFHSLSRRAASDRECALMRRERAWALLVLTGSVIARTERPVRILLVRESIVRALRGRDSSE